MSESNLNHDNDSENDLEAGSSDINFEPSAALNSKGNSSHRSSHRGSSRRDSKQDAKSMGDVYVEKLISVSRNAKVVTGGKIFTFTALVAVGDGNGRVALGRGKAREVPVAIQKAMDNARKNMKQVHLNGDTIWYLIVFKFGATRVFMRPAAPGTGIIAGGAVRSVLEVLGVKNVLSKTYGSTNPVNAARATLGAVCKIKSPEYYALKRGKTLEEIKN